MTYQKEKKGGRTPCYNQDAETKIDDNKESRIEEDHNLGDWLSLVVNKDETLSAAGESHHQAKVGANSKIFSCNFCTRKFYSSQALGRHQNAHKRERGAARRFHSGRMMMNSIGFPFNTLPARSLGVQPHSPVHKPNRESGPSLVARIGDTSAVFGMMPWTAFMLEEATLWPGSFRVENSPKQASNLHKIDLNLKL